jgi:DNA-binding FadR family transcriptional regulator
MSVEAELDVPPREEEGRLYEAVARRMLEDVLAGVFVAGGALPNERSLTSRYGVSRTVLREAVQDLTRRGVLDVRHGAGTFVRPLPEWDFLDPMLLGPIERSGSIGLILRDLLEARRMIEGEAVALAAVRATEPQRRYLKDLVARMRSMPADDQRQLDLDVAFHGAIVVASNNVVLQRLADRVSGLVRAVVLEHYDELMGPERIVSIATHELILTAIETRNPERARAALLAHLQRLENTAAGRTADPPPGKPSE